MRFNPLLSLVLFSLAAVPFAPAQQSDSASQARSSQRPEDRMRRDGRDMRPDFRIAPPGMWWKNPTLVQKLGLSPEQVKNMDDIFQQNRSQLIELYHDVRNQEALLRPMLDENPPDANKVLAQIDRTAHARADLERANARMLLGIRGVLTPDQWTKLQAEERENRRQMMQRYNKSGDSQHNGSGPQAHP